MSLNTVLCVNMHMYMCTCPFFVHNEPQAVNIYISHTGLDEK